MYSNPTHKDKEVNSMRYLAKEEDYEEEYGDFEDEEG